MAHFAQLDENNVVIQVIVVANNELLLDGVESEAKGVIFCKSLFGEDTNWVQTSYNATIRKNYAGIGFSYNAIHDVFTTPQPFPSWLLDENYDWQAPISKPELGDWCWNESQFEWVIAPQPFPSWSLDDNFYWQAPSLRPAEGAWYWNEEDLEWVEIPVSE